MITFDNRTTGPVNIVFPYAFSCLDVNTAEMLLPVNTFMSTLESGETGDLYTNLTDTGVDHGFVDMTSRELFIDDILFTAESLVQENLMEAGFTIVVESVDSVPFPFTTTELDNHNYYVLAKADIGSISSKEETLSMTITIYS